MATKTAEATKKAKPENDPSKKKDMEKAKALGLSLVHFRILTAMKTGKDFTYKDIEAKTGYYASLTAAMHPKHEGSLGSLGLVNLVEPGDGGKKITFSISAKGKALMAKK
jgi:hypothetical protein